MKTRNQIIFVVMMAIVFVVITETPLAAQPKDRHHGFVLKGPWELVVQKGMQGQALRFPVAVEQDDKPQVLNKVFPILGTPVKLKILEYLPDLKRETLIEEKKGAGGVVSLTIKGPNLQQQMFLVTDDAQQRSLSSKIGGVGIVKLDNPKNFKKNIERLTNSDTVGILSVRLNDNTNQLNDNTKKTQDPVLPWEFVVCPKQEITLPKTQHRITILEYFPHFSIDNKTKTKSNLSDQPVNPAIKVRVEDGEKTYEKWLWSKFPSFGHATHPGSQETAQPLQLVFTHIGVGKDLKNHTIVVAAENEPAMLISENQKIKAAKLVIGQEYPFNEDYHFTIEQVTASAVLKDHWKNNSQTLQAPAIVVDVDYSEKQEQVVLELDKPEHIKSDKEMIVLMFRQQQVETDKVTEE